MSSTIGVQNIAHTNGTVAATVSSGGNITVSGDLISSTSGTSNFVAGVNAGNSIQSGGNYNVLVGDEAGTALTTGDYNSAFGADALLSNTTADDNTAVGYRALKLNTGGAANVAIGNYALDANTSGNTNTAVGYGSLTDCTEGFDNSAIGVNAGIAVTTGDNNTLLGHDAGRSGSPGGEITTHNNNIVLGDENVSAFYAQVSLTASSDQRDKTDFNDLDIGLDFVNALKPLTYKWDKRSKYGDKNADDYDLNSQTPDGTHKEDWLDIGFKAQEVEALEKSAGYKIADKTNLVTKLTKDGKQYGIQYEKFVPILVKAIQELSAKNDALEARITALENG